MALTISLKVAVWFFVIYAVVCASWWHTEVMRDSRPCEAWEVIYIGTLTLSRAHRWILSHCMETYRACGFFWAR